MSKNILFNDQRFYCISIYLSIYLFVFLDHEVSPCFFECGTNLSLRVDLTTRRF